MHLNDIASFLLYLLGVFILAFTFRRAVMKSQAPTADTDWKKRLAEEHDLQFVRNKPLDQALFIKIDFKAFPVVAHEACHKQYLALMRYATYPMINLKSQSNLELKKQYGPQIVEAVSNYERTYTSCMHTAIAYAELLWEHQFISEAQKTLEICVAYHCDLTKCYLLLIDLYKIQHNDSALNHLKATAEKEMGDSPFLPQILRHFNDDLKESV